MRLKQYILQEGSRSKNISKLEAQSIIKSDCMVSYEAFKSNKARIYRGLPTPFPTGYKYINPKTSERRSANTDNYYTYIIDNSKSWSKYPKRSRSIICTTDKSYADNFGYIGMVFPIDGSKIGVASSPDFWGSFEQTITRGFDLDEFNYMLKKIVKKQNVMLDDKSLSSFKKTLSMFDKNINDWVKTLPGKNNSPSFDVDFMDGYKDNLWDHLQTLFEPKKNGITLTKVGKPLPNNREVWTDGISIIIDEDVMGELNI